MNQSKYLIQKRRDRIMELLRRDNIVYVSHLAKVFNVADMTIRRDLEYLEQEGMLNRFHGGAKAVHRGIRKPEELVMPEFSDTIMSQLQLNGDKKDRIAKAASLYISQGEVIFMNSGTTSLYLLKYLPGKNVRIVTNNAAMSYFNRSADTEVIVSGGQHIVCTNSYVGPLAKKIFTDTMAAKCFLSVSGISYHNGITCSNYQETELNKLMLNRSTELKVVLADGSKVGMAHNFTTCKLTDIDMLITDNSADPQEVQHLMAAGIKVLIV